MGTHEIFIERWDNMGISTVIKYERILHVQNQSQADMFVRSE